MAGPAPDLGGLPEWVRTDLARLLPELGAPSPPLREAAEQARFVEACVQGWLALGAESFDAVILDDWHLADTASVELLGFVAQRRVERAMAAPRELLVLRPALEPATRAALERLVRATQALHLALAPLRADAVFDLLRQLSGAEAPRLFSRRLARATGGNPFFLAETLRHLAEAGMLSTDAYGAWRTPFAESPDDYGELPVPASVLDAVRERVQALAEAPRRMLEVAALAGEPFTPALLAGAAALSELDALLAIEQAVAAQMLREHESGGFAFAHDLVQQAIEGRLGTTRRRLVHRRLAIAAAAAGAEPAVVATHHEAAGEPAQRLHARTQAVLHWEQGLADGPTLEQEAQLRRALVSTLHVMDLAERCAGHAATLQALSGLRLMYRLAFVDAHLALGELGAAWEHALGAVDDTLAVGEPYATLCTCLTSHELFALLDAEHCVHPLLVQLSTETLRQMPGPGTEAWLARAQAALMHQRTDEAAALLDDLSGDHPGPRVRARHSIARAQRALAQGDASATLQALPADDHPGLNPEPRLRSLAVCVEAQARSGGVAPTTLAMARQALDEPPDTAHPPHALAALLLRHALQVAGHETAADRAALQALATTLAGHPAEQAAFVRRWL